MVGKCHSADLVGTSPLNSVCTPVTASKQALVFLPCSCTRGADQVARLHHRPAVHPTVTGTPKQAETRSDVTTSHNGPAAINAP
jgi:hypothetical protein